jgi:CheY-like chemotaxis protein
MKTCRARILVAEDDATIRDLLSVLLEQEGYTVVLARDGIEALREALAQQPDLILLDLAMPNLGGHDFCRVYHDQGGTAPVILATATDVVQTITAAKACGAVAYIRKPFETNTLLATIDRYLPRPRR